MRPVAFTLLLGPALAAAPACFNPPAAQVLFSCEPAGASECPDGYECRADGCCHREGSPADAAAECKFGGGGASEGATAGSSTAGATTGLTTGGVTDATTGTSATATSGSTSTSTSTGPQTTGTT